MKKETILLGGKQYEVTERPTRANKAWRDELTAVIKPVADIVQQVTGGGLILPESMGELKANPAILADLGGAVRDLSGLLLGGLDQVLTLIIDYSPVLQADRVWIEENAYDSEILDALVPILKMAYPFDRVINPLVKIGSPMPPTSPNSPAPNGVYGMMNSTPSCERS